MSTIEPDPAAVICGTTARDSRKALVRLTASASVQSESGQSATLLRCRRPPALATATSIGPKAALVRATMSATAASLVASACSARARPAAVAAISSAAGPLVA